jgi:hypothetical protein
MYFSAATRQSHRSSYRTDNGVRSPRREKHAPRDDNHRDEERLCDVAISAVIGTVRLRSEIAALGCRPPRTPSRRTSGNDNHRGDDRNVGFGAGQGRFCIVE